MESELKAQEKELGDDLNNLAKKSKYLEKQFNDASGQLRDIVRLLVILYDQHLLTYFLHSSTAHQSNSIPCSIHTPPIHVSYPLVDRIDVFPERNSVISTTEGYIVSPYQFVKLLPFPKLMSN